MPARSRQTLRHPTHQHHPKGGVDRCTLAGREKTTLAARRGVGGSCVRVDPAAPRPIPQLSFVHTAMQLAIFDLDGTLLGGDSDSLWCRFLIQQQWLDPSHATRCDQVAALYAAGTVVPEEYARCQAGLLTGRSVADLLPLRQRFLAEVIRPRIPHVARELLQRHRLDGDTLVLTTATPRVVSELTAQDLGVDAYLCTELEVVGGRFTGRVVGAPNMRIGKVDRLRNWLAAQGQGGGVLKRATFYSDSINDLALLSVVGRPIVVDPDPRLAAMALRKGWTQLALHHHHQRELEPSL